MEDCSTPFVSIVIPVFNGEQYLDTCLKKLMEQNYPREYYEIIVVDNNSTDNSLDIAKNYDVKVVSCLTKGPSAARNAGVTHTNGDILIFIDVDCVADTHLIQQHVMTHTQSKKEENSVAIVGGAITGLNENYWALCDDFCAWTESHPKMPARYADYYWPTANMSLVKHVFKQVGGFNEALKTGEDVELCIKVRAKGYKIYFNPTAKVLHQNRTSMVAVMKRILSWASIGPDHIKFGVVRRDETLTKYRFMFKVFFEVFLKPISRSFLVKRYHVLISLPFLAINAILFSFLMTRALYDDND